jgi:tRNA1(Val) A37 N6-methylase TrmN6
VRATEAVVKLFFTVYGEEGVFRYGTDSTREVLALFFLYPRVDEIDDVGSGSRSLMKTRGILPAMF